MRSQSGGLGDLQLVITHAKKCIEKMQSRCGFLLERTGPLVYTLADPHISTEYDLTRGMFHHCM